MPSNLHVDDIVNVTDVMDVFSKLPDTGGKQENEAHKAYLSRIMEKFSDKWEEHLFMYDVIMGGFGRAGQGP